jgi:hypothetical protein
MKKHLLLIYLFIFLCSLVSNSQTLEELQKVIPDEVNAAKDFRMGYAIDIDGNYAVVGENGYNGSKGRLYVFFFDGSKWNKVAHLTASDSKLSYDVGNSVAIEGNTIVAGAVGCDDAGEYSGAAYVFV